MKWYCYMLIDPGTRLPFYVGKGQGDRINAHTRDARQHPNHACHNPYKCRKIRSMWQAGRDVEQVKVFVTDDEQAAFYVERSLIAGYRARGVQLCNLTNGGEGTEGYQPTEEQRAKVSAALKKTLGAPERRAKISATTKAAWARATPETRERLSATMRASWADPKHHALMVERLQASAGRPANRARVREQVKARWADPEYRARLSQASSAALSTPEARARTSEQVKARWADPEYRARLSAAQKAALSTPEARAKRSAIAKASAARRWAHIRACADELCALYATGEYTMSALGAKFGMNRATVRRVIRAGQKVDQEA